jgi:CRP-like cAMP-binding protein
MAAGTPGDSMYFFLEGTVEVWPALSARQRKAMKDPNGKPLVKLKAGVVSLFGEMAMLTNEPRSATITAASDCVLYEISRDDFTALCDRAPVLGLKLMRGIAFILAERVRKGNDEQIRLWQALGQAAAKGNAPND